MCKIMEDMRNEAAREAAREAAQQAAHKKAKEKAKLMLQNGKISMDEMSTFFPELSDEEIKEFEAEIMQLV